MLYNSIFYLSLLKDVVCPTEICVEAKSTPLRIFDKKILDTILNMYKKNENNKKWH